MIHTLLFDIFTNDLKRGQENFPDDMKLCRMRTVKNSRKVFKTTGFKLTTGA